MPVDNSNEKPVKPSTAPEVNRINIALPFAKIVTLETSEELRDLATLVADLAEVVERLAPNTDAQQIHARTKTLAARLS
jgi:hypothetical protein